MYANVVHGGQQTETTLLVYLDVIAVFLPLVYVSLCRALPRSLLLSLFCFLFPEKTSEDFHSLSKHMKVLKKKKDSQQPISPSSTPFCYFTVAYCQHSHTWISVSVTIGGRTKKKKKTLTRRLAEWHVWIFPLACFLIAAIGPCCAAEFLYASNPQWALWCMPKT